VAFGGAGPLHACALAEELEIETILVPRASGVLSALGLAISDLRRDRVAPIHALVDELDPAELDRRFGSLETDGETFERRADLRYRGQAFELAVPADDLGALDDRFQAEHERRHGYRMEGEPVELVNLRVAALVPTEELRLAGEPGDPVDGPAVVELPEATCYVAPGWHGENDETGTLVLTRA
jgi:N-methylhydantoinase A